MKKFVPIACLLALAACSKTRDDLSANTLRVALREKVRTMDPAHASDYYSNVEVSRAYEGLLQYSYYKRPYAIEPNLAEAMPAVSQDGLTYTFKLRAGVLFHDDACFAGGKGRELVAEDFVYSFKRLLDPKEASDGKWIFDGKVKEFRAKDARTLEIVLTKAYAPFLHVLTMPYSFVVAKECVEKYGEDFGRHPVGTGPFRLDRRGENQIVWVKTPAYRKVLFPENSDFPGDAGKTIPFVDRIVDDVITEDQPAWLNFMQGNHDYLMKIPKDNVAAVWGTDHKPTKELLDKGVGVLVSPAMNFTYTAFNMEDPVVGGEKNKWLRQAMSLAYDEAPLIEKFYLGLAQRAEFLVPPEVAGYDAHWKNPYRQVNVAKARDILARNGHAGGKGIPELEYASLSDTTGRQLTEHFIRAMSEIGIQIKLNAMTWPELLSRIRTKKNQVFGISWLYDYPDAENGFQLLYSKNSSPGPNEANYTNHKFDSLYEKAAPMADSAARQALWVKARDLMAEDVPWIFGVHKMETRLVQSWTKNYKIHAFEHGHEKYMRIDTEARKQNLR